MDTLLSGGLVQPSTLIHAATGLYGVVKAQQAKARGPSTGHTCDICKKEIFKKTDRFRCMGCPDFDACAKCFPQIRHPRHMFVKVPAVGDLEAVLHGMPHPICDGCGLAIGGQTWMCATCTAGAFILCNSCFPERPMKHPGHDFIRYRSWHYPGASFPLKCKGCGLQVKSSMWECDDCPDMASCNACYPWLRTHNPQHYRFSNAVMAPT